jgi:hypothetical protein
MRIRDILMRIRIQLWIQLLSPLILRMKKKNSLYFLLITCPQAHHFQSKKLNFLLNFCVKILFCKHYFIPLNTFMRKKDPDPYLWLMDPDPGGPKPCGSVSTTLRAALLLLPAWASSIFKHLTICKQSLIGQYADPTGLEYETKRLNNRILVNFNETDLIRFSGIVDRGKALEELWDQMTVDPPVVLCTPDHKQDLKMNYRKSDS